MPDSNNAFKEAETHWKLRRIAQGLEAVSEDDEGGNGAPGDASPMTSIDPEWLSAEDIALLKQHGTRQERHLKEAKQLRIERQYMIQNGHSVNNSIQHSSDNNMMAHPLSHAAQFHANQENNNQDTNKDRANELQLRHQPTNAPAPRTQPTPSLTR